MQYQHLEAAQCDGCLAECMEMRWGNHGKICCPNGDLVLTQHVFWYGHVTGVCVRRTVLVTSFPASTFLMGELHRGWRVLHRESGMLVVPEGLCLEKDGEGFVRLL